MLYLRRKISFLYFYIRSVNSNIPKLIKNKQYWHKSETYFPNNSKKNSCKIFLEQLLCIFRYGEINQFYFLYGFDVKKKKECNQYIQYCDFMRKRNKRNSKLFNELCILRDKSLFAIFGEYWGIPIVRTFGIYENGIITKEKGESFNFLEYINSRNEFHLFIKPLDDECGKGIFCIDKTEENITINDIESNLKLVDCYLKNLDNKKYLVQDRLIQHNEINKIYANSINSLRIITVKDKDSIPVFFDSLLRIGANGNIVDNWAKGGIAIGISPNGTLRSHGFFKPSFGKIVYEHPNTKTRFEDFEIPYYKDAIDVCIAYHKKIKGVATIGWDVAITKDGPVIIEGNDNYEISLHQACNGGLKRKFYNFYNAKF